MDKYCSCCALTGLRPYKSTWKHNEDNEQCVALKAALTEQIMPLVEAGVTDCYSRGADDVDCWTALTVLELRKKPLR